MADTLDKHMSLNGFYELGRKARVMGWPVCSCPRNLDSDHREAWLRGYREQSQ